MTSSTIEGVLLNYLSDAHAIEEQALQQLRMAPDVAGESRLAEILEQHRTETEGHEQLVLGRLEAHGAGPSRVKDVVMKAGGVGFILFAGAQPDTPGKLLSHAYSYEHLELAAYELLGRVASWAEDEETVDVARRIRDEEEAMAVRLSETFDRTVDASLGEKDPKTQLTKYLADAHAIEAQALQLLEKGPKIAGDPELADIYAEHLEETQDQQDMIRDRIEVYNSSPSTLKDAGLRLGALNWGMFFQAQPDTPGKLAAFAYAFEHLEIAGYEQLKRVAQRVGDDETIRTVEHILTQERAAGHRIASAFDRAAVSSLQARGITI